MLKANNHYYSEFSIQSAPFRFYYSDGLSMFYPITSPKRNIGTACRNITDCSWRHHIVNAIKF
ncbi:hypothetical protein O9992_05785 [Vibrio lentus]|nr:hypothetical protein [Vibrio lentus]